MYSLQISQYQKVSKILLFFPVSCQVLLKASVSGFLCEPHFCGVHIKYSESFLFI